MNISDIQKYEWEESKEWPEKWYNLELCFSTFAENGNPLTKLLGIKKLGVISLNKKWFYEKASSDFWERRKDLGCVSVSLSKLNLQSKNYLKEVRRIITLVEKTRVIDAKELGEIKKGMTLLWRVINADLGNHLGQSLNNRLQQWGLSADEIDNVKDFCVGFENDFDFQLEKQNLKLIKRIYENEYGNKIVSFETISPNIKKLLTSHWKKFRHLSGYDIDTDYFTVKDFFEKLIEPSPKRGTFRKSLSPKIKSKLKEDNWRFVNLVKDHIFLDNHASDIYAKLDFLFLDNLSRRFRISPKELSWYSFSEIESLIKNGIKLTNLKLKERKKYRVMVQLNREAEMFYGKNKFDEIKKLMHISQQKLVSQIAGFAASRGLVRGRVRIVNGVNDIGKVKAGDILVTTNTSPDLVLAINRCAGIITDYGGITSHAAIISREFGIPCIVGTDIATQVLKDGNIVELDANKGFVKILSLR